MAKDTRDPEPTESPEPIEEEPTPEKPIERTENEQKVARAFVRLTGYRDRDIMGINTRTLMVSTFTGGKYQLNRKGTSYRKLMGPDAPKLAEEEAE